MDRALVSAARVVHVHAPVFDPLAHMEETVAVVRREARFAAPTVRGMAALVKIDRADIRMVPDRSRARAIGRDLEAAGWAACLAPHRFHDLRVIQLEATDRAMKFRLRRVNPLDAGVGVGPGAEGEARSEFLLILSVPVDDIDRVVLADVGVNHAAAVRRNTRIAIAGGATENHVLISRFRVESHQGEL